MMFWIIFILLNLLVDTCNNYKIISLSFVTSDLLGLARKISDRSDKNF